MVYEPAEDTQLFLEYLKTLDLKGKSFLEIGCGSGVLSKQAQEQGSDVTAVDINPEAIKETKKLLPDSQVFESDIFTNIKESNDIIIWNTPYLPEDKREPQDMQTKAISSGKKGNEAAIIVLEQLEEHLNLNGVCYLLFSSASHPQDILDVAKQYMYTAIKVATKNVFMEELMIYEFTRSPIKNQLIKDGITNPHIIGHGKRSQVARATYQNTDVAVKITKENIVVPTARNEAAALHKVNALGLGPKLLSEQDNYVVYEFVEGEHIEGYMESCSKQELIETILELFRQAHLLDKHGIEKQEMSRLHKHVYKTKTGIVMIDWERLRESDQPSNVTQLTQWLATDRVLALLKKHDIILDKQQLRDLAKQYKQSYNSVTFIKDLFVQPTDPVA